MKRESETVSPTVNEAVFHSFIRMWGLLRQVQEPYFAQFGISAAQWGILRVLQRAGLKGETELPLKEVSNRLLIQPPSVTGVVDRLERQGLVKRSPSQLDLRVRHLSLTPEGRKLLSKVLKGHAERIQSLFAGLESQEKETMLNLLKRVETHLRTLVTPPADDKASTKMQQATRKAISKGRGGNRRRSASAIH